MANNQKTNGKRANPVKHVTKILPGQRGTSAKFVVPQSKPSLVPTDKLKTKTSKNASLNQRRDTLRDRVLGGTSGFGDRTKIIKDFQRLSSWKKSPYKMV